MDDTTANPTPSFDFNSVFDKLMSTTATLGGNYLTEQGQVAVAQAQANAQARINGYSQVNPSLGPVNPAAAQQVANQTWLQRWLPGGSPIVGAPATGTVAQAQTTGTIQTVVLLLGVILLGLVLFRMIRKK